MSLRLVQAGLGASRPLVASFLSWSGLDTKLRAAFGPAPCIVADDNAKGTETMGEILEFAHKVGHVEHVTRFALVGFSAGCQRVRKLRMDGAQAAAYLLSDGTHASWPPQAWQIDWLREIANEAKAGKVLVVASHTWQTYTEELKAPLTPFASTVTVLREATGFPLEKGGPPEAPVVSREGQLWVYSYATAKADYKAHSYQAMVVQPKLAALHVAPWLVNGAGPVVVDVEPEGERAPKVASKADGGIGAGLVLGGLVLMARRFGL